MMTMRGRKDKLLASLLGMAEWYDDKAGIYTIDKPYVAEHLDAINKLLAIGYKMEYCDTYGEVYPEDVAGDETFAVIYDPADWE